MMQSFLLTNLLESLWYVTVCNCYKSSLLHVNRNAKLCTVTRSHVFLTQVRVLCACVFDVIQFINNTELQNNVHDKSVKHNISDR